MAIVALFAAVGGFVLASKLGSPDAIAPPEQLATPEALLGKLRPDFSLVDSTGTRLQASDFDGQVLLLNFWATWCKPCVEEMPMLSRLAADYSPAGFAVLGVTVDDPQKASEFIEDMSLAYPVTAGAKESAVLGRRYGNRSGMLPYSVLIDRKGVVRWTHLGALELESVMQQIDALL